MIDWRKPKQRRRGELHGQVDWKRARAKFWTVCCFVTFACLMFLAGAIYESIQPIHKARIWNQYESSRITGH
ncbi:MAG: hypothetical protein ABIE47_06585 [Pseudomonadota bacterium]